MNKDIIILISGVIARHLVSALGGRLIDRPEAVSEITGALVVLISIGVSIYYKVRDKE